MASVDGSDCCGVKQYVVVLSLFQVEGYRCSDLLILWCNEQAMISLAWSVVFIATCLRCIIPLPWCAISHGGSPERVTYEGV